MRKRALLWVLVLGIGTGLLWLGRAHGLGRQPPAVPSEIATASLRKLEVFVKATGIVKPKSGAEIDVGTALSGLVRRLYVKTGDRVQAGQVLFDLDARTFRARKDQAAAARASAEANLTFARAELDRQRTLSTSGAIAAVALESAERNHAVALSALAEIRAQLDFARTQLADTRVTAPICGVVAAMNIQQGETITAGSLKPASITLIDLECLEVWAYVDETDIGRIVIDQPVRFTVDTYPDREFEGKVTAIYPKPEIRDNVVNFVVRIDFEPSEKHILRPEMTTNVRIFTSGRGEVLTISRRAIRRERGQPYVVVRAGKNTVRKDVVLGIHDDDYVEITKGLTAGSEVLVAPASIDTQPKEATP
ncbi:MAG: efflux RND transporter periplasmic adaptor subunit [Polyangiaceae bacterium]